LNSFKIPKKGPINIKVPNPIFLNFTYNEQRSLFKIFDTPKDSASILTNTNPTPINP